MACPIYKTQREKFQFGAGEPQTSNILVLFPSALGEVCCYLGASLLPANIPFLCSLRALDKLGLVLDLPNRCAVFRAVNREVPLVYLNGHLAVPIMDFPDKHVVERELQSLVDHGPHDPEVNVLPSSQIPHMEQPTPSHVLTAWRDLVRRMTHLAKGLWIHLRAAKSMGIITEEHYYKRDKLEAAARRSTGGKKAGSQGEDNKLGQSTNSQADECTQGNPSNSGMLTPGVQEVRQRLGSVRQMRGVPGKMEMGNGEWKPDGFSSKSQPPQPSAGLQESQLPYPNAATSSAVPPKAPNFNGLTRPLPKTRSRAPSMTASAAGHGALTAEALQEFDMVMDNAFEEGSG